MVNEISYVPLNTLKPVADNVWVVDGPEIRFGFGPLKILFPTRMTVIRLPENKLLVHSPTALTPGLKKEIDAIGLVTDIVAPNKIHYWWVRDWNNAYEDAHVLAAADMINNQKCNLPSNSTALEGTPVRWWAEYVSHIPVTGGYMTEIVLFHHPSQTLILTDLIENFESTHVPSFMKRLVLRFAGILHPNGSMPRDMRLTYHGRENHLRQAVCQMMDWEPERIIISHGKCYDNNCRQELARAFSFVGVGN